MKRFLILMSITLIMVSAMVTSSYAESCKEKCNNSIYRFTEKMLNNCIDKCRKEKAKTFLKNTKEKAKSTYNKTSEGVKDFVDGLKKD